MASPKKLAHFVLASRNQDSLVDWYVTMLDAKVRFNNGILAFLSFDDEHHRLAIANLEALGDERVPSASKGTLEHIAFTYENIGDLLENYARVKEKGIEPYWCINHGITFSMYFADPDGNQVEMQVDAFDNADDANAFMSGPVFQRNPIGVEFDPDEILARYRAGESAELLMHFDADAPPGALRLCAERNNPLFPPRQASRVA